MELVYDDEKTEEQCTSLKSDENKEPYHPCNIDEISQNVRIVEITEVSKHYE